MSSHDTAIQQTTNQNDVNLFSQLRFSRPLKDFINPVNVPPHPPSQSGILLKQVFLLTHLDRQEDLRLTQWIEMNEDLLQTARELIPGKILNGLESRYKILLKQEVEFYKFYQQTLPELRKRISNQQQRVLIHYISRSIYNSDGLIMAQDEQSRQPVSINVAELAKMINDKVIFIFDCNGAGKLIEGLLKQREVIGFASCLASQKMPFTNYQTSRLIPTDIFSVCMTDPMLGLSISFIYRNEIRLQRNEIRSYQQLIEFYNRKIKNVEIVNQILLIIKYITECLAFNNLDSDRFEQLFRIDDNTISVVQNYFVAQRVMSLLNLQTTTTLDLPDLSDHHLWISLDVILNEFFNNDLIIEEKVKESSKELSRSGSVLSLNGKPAQSSKIRQFFTFEQDQIQSFELQLNYLNEQSKKPDNITIIISLLKQQSFKQRCFLLLCKFVDLCPSSIDQLSVAGLPLVLFNFILKKQQEPEIFRCVGFLLVKILSFDLSQAVRYVHYLQHQRQTKSNTQNQRDTKVKLQLVLIAEVLHPKLFDVSSRLISLQILTIFTSKVLNNLLRSSDNSEQSKLVNDIRQYIIHNQGLDLLKVFIHSSDMQIKLWATLLYGNLMSILPRYLGQAINRSTKESSSDDKLTALNTEDSFNLLQQEMTILLNLRNSSFCPEIRAASIRAIGNCFLESKNQSTPVQNSVTINAYKFPLDEHFVQQLCLSVGDPSNIVRYELIRVLTKVVQCYLWSSIKEIERLLGQQLNYINKQETGDKFIPQILIALDCLALDPNKLISLYAGSIINNLKNLSLMHIAKQYIIGNAYISANQSLMKISEDDPDAIQSNSIFLSRTEIKLFQEKIRERKRITEQDLIILLSRQDDDQLYQDDQINQDYASFRASLQLSFLSQNEKSLNAHSSQLSSLMSESNIVQAISQTTKLKLCETVVDSISIIQEVDTSTSRAQNQTPETKRLKSVQIKYEFLRYKQQQLQIFDKMLSQFSFSIFYGKLQHAHTLFQSVILNIAFYGLQQQQITSNLIQLGQSISQRTHRSIQSCTQHHTLIGREEGCRCRRLFTFQCQLCQKLAVYGINLGLTEKFVTNNSSCFMLLPEYSKSSVQKQKHVSSISSSSQTQQTFINYVSFVQYLQNAVNKDKILERKLLYIQNLQNLQKQIQSPENNVSFSNEVSTIQYQQLSDYDLQNYLLQMKLDSQLHIALKLKEKFSPQTCQSYIFSLLQMLSSEEMIQHNIPIQLCNQLPDSYPKHRQTIPFQVNDWKMTNEKLLNAQSQNNLNIMTEGLITQQTQQPYDSKTIQMMFNQPIVLIERFSKNQALTNIQLTAEQQSQIALIDQSCTICRHIAVQHSLLNLSALSQFYFYQKQFIFYPTRDVRPLIIQVSGKGQRKDAPNENQYSSFINKFLSIMASPFPYFDEAMFCDSIEIFNHHQMARCIYRSTTNNYDILIPQFYLSHRLAAKQYSIQQMQNHDKESLWSQEPEFDWIVSYLQRCMELYIQPQRKQFQLVMNKKDYSSSQLEQIRCFPKNEGNINHYNHIARTYFKEQYDYLEHMRVQKQQQYCRTFPEKPKQINYYATITTLKKPYLIKFHPSAPFMFIVGEDGMYQYNVQQQLNCNNLSQQFLNNFSPSVWPGHFLQHQHTSVSPNIDSVEKLMEQYYCGKNGQIFGHIYDSDIECQYCAICQSIKCSNGDDDNFINPDRLDHFMTQSFNQQTGNKSQFSQLNLYPQMACPFGQIPQLISNRTHSVPDDKVVDIGFLNTDQPNLLMTTSGSKYTYRIFSNPLDIACTQQISAYQIFQRQNPFSVDTLCTLPVFDCMRHVAFESDNVDQELLNLYLEDKLNFCLAKLPSLQNQQIDMKHLFLTSAGYHNRNVAFSNYNEFKILDLVSEQFSKIKRFENFNISALDYDEITQRVVFGDFDGSVRVFDLKSNEIVQSFENRFYFPLNISVFNNQTSQHNIQVGFSSGRVKTYSNNQLVHEMQLCEETRNVICQKNMTIMGTTKDNKGLLSFNISGKNTKQDIKIDKFQKAFFNTDCDTFGTINDNIIKLYLMK